MKYIDQFSRILVGGLFIFSGLIKLNDPIGTEIKMEEYFEVFAKDFGSFFEIFIPWALEIAMIMIVLEVVLGVAVLLYYRMDITTWVLLVLMVFFTFLTGYSAILNKVTDCGCFGDFIKLTPWQSFWKDIILMVFVLHLFWHRTRFVAVLRTREGHAAIIAVTLLATYIGIHAINHLPYFDFRAYKVGNHIPTERQQRGTPIGEYIYEKDGKEVRDAQYLTPEQGYKLKGYDIKNLKEIEPRIKDYNITDDKKQDITEWTFVGPKLFITTVFVEKASLKNIDAVRTLLRELDGKVDIYILTASNDADAERFKHENQLPAKIFSADAVVLKTIVRANPGISLWKDGTVLGNWHHNDTPTSAEILELLQ